MYIYDPRSLAPLHVSMMRYFLVTNGRTDKAILGVREHQCSTMCGAIEDRSISLKAIDERVLINFRYKNAVFTNFCDKNAVFTHFRDKNAVFTNFCDKNAEFTCDKNLFCR